MSSKTKKKRTKTPKRKPCTTLMYKDIQNMLRSQSIDIYLKNNGVIVIPLIQDGLDKIRAEFDKALKEFREFDQKSTPDRYVLGGFSALGNPSSFHNLLVRKLRQWSMSSVVSKVWTPYIRNHYDSTWKVEQVIDRMLYRPVGASVSKESWHRDEAINAPEGIEQEMFGGWINLDQTSQYFNCVLGTHTTVPGQNGFSKIKDDTQIQHYENNCVSVEIPPGHIIVFFEHIVHEIVSKKHASPMYRLFVGWRLSTDTNPLFPSDIPSKLYSQDVMKLKSGQIPTMYSKLHWTNWRKKITEFSQNIVSQCKTNRTVRSGKEKGIEYKDIVQQTMKSLSEYKLPMYPDYTTDEIQMHNPNRTWHVLKPGSSDTYVTLTLEDSNIKNNSELERRELKEVIKDNSESDSGDPYIMHNISRRNYKRRVIITGSDTTGSDTTGSDTMGSDTEDDIPLSNLFGKISKIARQASKVESERTIVIEQLVSVFLECLEKHKEGSSRHNFPSKCAPQPPLFDIQVIQAISRSGNTYFALKGTLLLEPSIKAKLPKKYNVNRNKKVIFKKPKYYRNIGYIYPGDEMNKEILMPWYTCANELNQTYQSYLVTQSSPPYITVDKEFGILGWDVSCKLEDWMNSIFDQRHKDWNPRFNPSIDEKGKITFSKNRVAQYVAAKSIAHLKQKNPKKWSNLYQGVIKIQRKQEKYIWYDIQPTRRNSVLYTLQNNPLISDVLKSNKIQVLLINYSKHARFAFLNHEAKILTLFDPWQKDQSRKKMFKVICQALAKQGWSVKFNPRKGVVDQGREGSCQVISLVRALLLSQFGLEGATMSLKEKCAYVILGARLVSTFRNKRW